MYTFLSSLNGFITSWTSGPLAPFMPWIIIALALWELIWKGFALWYAARNNQRAWYVFILILNTIGILSILYIAFFRAKKNDVEKSFAENTATTVTQ